MDPLVRTVASRFQMARAISAKYKSKKKLDTGTVVYEYSDKQIAERHKGKARRYESLAGDIEKLRKKVKADLKSDDLETKMTALAVGLIDETFERVGNPASAKGEKSEDGEGHYGVTGWTKSHVSFGSGSATIKYVGKSGVDHEKKVTDKALVSALKEAHKAAEGKDGRIFEYEGGVVSAEKVNGYLEEFDVSAKDLRGYHANRLMQEALKAARSKGGKLPEDKKEREKKLKDEFKKALETTSEDVGHESATLRSQYLIPSMEEQFMKDGKVESSL